MKKNHYPINLSFRIVLFLLFALIGTTANARDLQQAKQAAMQQMKKSEAKKASRKGGTVITVEPQLVYSKEKAGAVPYYYVFTEGKDLGFTVVSGDDRLPAIVGYTENGDFNAEKLPDGLSDYLKAYQEFIDKATDEQIAEAAAFKAQTKHSTVAPLMQEKWNQGEPYYNMCPEVGGKKCFTGCTATAVAQILHYWKHPEKLQNNIPAYTTRKNGINMPAIAADENYDWANMLNTYTGSETVIQNDAVAKLMLHVGCATSMNYDPTGSSASATPETFIKYFGMDEDMIHWRFRDDFNIAEWDKMLYSEIEAKRPVLYGGQSSGGGHAFVIHGYDDGLYYVNWGWGGSSDGYFDISILNPDSNIELGVSSSNDGYSIACDMIIGIQPDNGVVDLVNFSQLQSWRFNSNNLTDLAFSNGKVTAKASFYMINPETTALTKYVSVGYKNENADIVNVSLPQNINFDANSSVQCAFDIAFCANEGEVYELCVIESNDGTSWVASVVNEEITDGRTVPVKINGSDVSVGSLQYILSALAKLNKTSLGCAGIGNTIDITVTNTGNMEYYDWIYVYVSKSEARPEMPYYKAGITVPVNGSITYNFSYTPSEAGTYNIWIYNSKTENNKDVPNLLIGEGQIAFNKMLTPPVLSICSIKCINASDETVFANIETPLKFWNYQNNYVELDFTNKNLQLQKIKDTKAEFEIVIKSDGDEDYKCHSLFYAYGNGIWDNHNMIFPANNETKFTFKVEGNVGDVVGMMIWPIESSVFPEGLKEYITHKADDGTTMIFDREEFVYLAGPDTPDGITDAIMDTNKVGDFYDLCGQKVSTPSKGIYIKNGKKYVFK